MGHKPELVESDMIHKYAVGPFLFAGSEILKLKE
jgi:hypothetical protein